MREKEDCSQSKLSGFGFKFNSYKSIYTIENAICLHLPSEYKNKTYM